MWSGLIVEASRSGGEVRTALSELEASSDYALEACVPGCHAGSVGEPENVASCSACSPMPH